MQRKTLLVTLVIVAIAVSAFLYFLLQPKTPGQAPVQTQPAQPVVNATKPQPAQNATQPQVKPPLITARIEASQGGKVLVNGTETATWNSTRPFTLLLKAAPDTCYAFDHWEVNGTQYSDPTLTLTVTGNTTIRAVFKVPVYSVTIKANATGVAAQINGENHTLPVSITLPACFTFEIKPLETSLYKPLNNTLKITVSRDTNIMLYYRSKSINSVQILINGKPQEVEVRQDPFVKSNGIIETTSDGLIHIKGNMSIVIYIPWNFTHVIVQADIIRLSNFSALNVGRYCDWNSDKIAYYKSFYDVTRVEFLGCEPFGVPHFGYIGGKRYDYQKPGAIFIDAINVDAWVKIEAYP